MRAFLTSMVACAAAAVAGVALFDSGAGPVRAADHFDPPARTDAAVDPTPDLPIDLADIYAWHTATSFNLALTFAGPVPQSRPASYDRDVVYFINVSNAGSKETAEFPIEFRFGEDTTNGGFGIQVKGLPGVNGDIVGPVETVLQKDGVKVMAGVFDDPFFFDVQGFRETRATGTLSIRSDRNLFDNQNDSGVVIEIPLDRIRNGTNRIGVWATSARLGGTQ